MSLLRSGGARGEDLRIVLDAELGKSLGRNGVVFENLAGADEVDGVGGSVRSGGDVVAERGEGPGLEVHLFQNPRPCPSYLQFRHRSTLGFLRGGFLISKVCVPRS